MLLFFFGRDGFDHLQDHDVNYAQTVIMAIRLAFWAKYNYVNRVIAMEMLILMLLETAIVPPANV